jgi:hypothetical protein
MGTRYGIEKVFSGDNTGNVRWIETDEAIEPLRDMATVLSRETGSVYAIVELHPVGTEWRHFTYFEGQEFANTAEGAVTVPA